MVLRANGSISGGLAGGLVPFKPCYMDKCQDRIRMDRRRNGALSFNGYRASVCDDERILEMDSSVGCMTF